MADCLFGKRWFQTKRSAFADRRTVCAGLGASLYLAYITTYVTFYKANTPKTNHTDSMDGSDLFVQCGKHSVLIQNILHFNECLKSVSMQHDIMTNGDMLAT